MLTAANGWIDFADDTHRLLFNITQDTTNHRFVKELARDVLRGQLKAAAEGRRQGGRAPFGYRLVYETDAASSGRRARRTRLVVEEEAAALIRELFQAYAAGETSLYRLARDLNAKGVKPVRAAKWSPTAIRAHPRQRDLPGDAGLEPDRSGQVLWRRGHAVAAEVRHPQDGPPLRPAGRPPITSASRDTMRPLWTGRPLTPCSGCSWRSARAGTVPTAVCTSCAPCCALRPVRRADGGQETNLGPAETHYRCGTYNAHGPEGGCPATALYEAPLVRCIARKLQAEVFNEDRLADLGGETLKTLAEGQGDGQAEARPSRTGRPRSEARHRQRTLPHRAGSGGRRALPGGHATAARPQARPGRDHCGGANAAVRPAGRGSRHRQGVSHARRLDEAFAVMDPAAQRAVLRDLLDRVEVFFRKEDRGPEQAATGLPAAIFVRGLIWLKPGIFPEISSRACRDRETSEASCPLYTSLDRH